jgi:hypothetical protein
VLTGGKDDRVFRLDRVDDAACARDDTAWEGDFRKCQVEKKFPQGKVIIQAGEQIELDIRWNDGVDLDEVVEVDPAAADISVQIDNKPLKIEWKGELAGIVYGLKLGSFNAILPALSRGKRLQILFPGKPQRSVDLNVGDGRKPVAFLKKCAKFWSCVADRGLPGKAKHCYLPRLDLDLR